MMQLPVVDINDHVTFIEVMGHHIPAVEVRLLSPQVFLSSYDGQMVQTS